MVFCAKNTDLKLANGDKGVIGGIGKVYKFNGGAFFACFAVLGDAGIFLEQGEEMAVIFEEVIARKVGSELFDDFFDLVWFEPRVNDLELLAQDWQ